MMIWSPENRSWSDLEVAFYFELPSTYFSNIYWFSTRATWMVVSLFYCNFESENIRNVCVVSIQSQEQRSHNIDLFIQSSIFFLTVKQTHSFRGILNHGYSSIPSNIKEMTAISITASPHWTTSQVSQAILLSLFPPISWLFFNLRPEWRLAEYTIFRNI